MGVGCNIQPTRYDVGLYHEVYLLPKPSAYYTYTYNQVLYVLWYCRCTCIIVYIWTKIPNAVRFRMHLSQCQYPAYPPQYYQANIFPLIRRVILNKIHLEAFHLLSLFFFFFLFCRFHWFRIKKNYIRIKTGFFFPTTIFKSYLRMVMLLIPNVNVERWGNNTRYSAIFYESGLRLLLLRYAEAVH